MDLAARLKARRQEIGLSQIELAARLHSSQSRVAKMEAAGQDVSLDLLVRGMLAVGLKL
jgi:transcriptional regulator with XRE-family HTH domain